MPKVKTQEPVEQEQTEQEPKAKTGQRLILLDGTKIEDGLAGYADGKLWCWIHGFTMREAADIFFDAAKTGKIICEQDEMSHEYADFTNCVNLFIDSDGKVSACLTRRNANV